jgi:hypothetical protein
MLPAFRPRIFSAPKRSGVGRDPRVPEGVTANMAFALEREVADDGHVIQLSPTGNLALPAAENCRFLRKAAMRAETVSRGLLLFRVGGLL